jgi:glyoxylase-like metal-dependent hydrolase (beta-lactamase superfamily II)
MNMLLRVKAVGPWRMNAYALVCPATLQSVLIDPGDEPRALDALLEGTRPAAILITHSHPDHVGALEVMRARLQVPVMAHPALAGAAIDRTLADRDRVAVGEHWLKVHNAPGHTADQLCFAIEQDDRVIVGDTIFEGGPGKTWSPEDFRTTLDTLRRVVLAWPDDTRCYPGHGNPFRLGDIRNAVEAFIAKDHDRFCGDATWGM